jgi:DNA uptake protein ComE-like DNA-binding protein
LARVLGIKNEEAIGIVEGALQMIQREEGSEVSLGVPPAEEPALHPVDRMEGVGEKTAAILQANGFQTVQDILKTNVENLSTLPGIGIKKAEKLIQSARRYVEGPAR